MQACNNLSLLQTVATRPRNIDNHPRTEQWPISGQPGPLLAPLLQSFPSVLTLHSQTRFQNLENGGARDNFVSFSPQDSDTLYGHGAMASDVLSPSQGIDFGQENSVQKSKACPSLPPSAQQQPPPPPPPPHHHHHHHHHHHFINGIWSLSLLLGVKIIHSVDRTDLFKISNLV